MAQVLSKLQSLGWETSPQGQQIASDDVQMSGLIGREQYETGAGPYLNDETTIRATISGIAYGGAQLDLEIRPLISGVGYGASFVEPYELRPLFTGFAYFGGDLEKTFFPFGVFAQSSEADDGILIQQVHYPAILASGGGSMTGQLPVPFIAASGTAPGVGRLDLPFGFGDGAFPTFAIVGSGTGGRRGVLDLVVEDHFSSFGQIGWDAILPPFFKMSIEASGTTAAVGQLIQNVPRVTIEAEGTVGHAGILDVVIDPPIALGPAELVALVPRIRLIASGGEIVEPEIVGYAVNVSLNAMTRYDHWPFAHVVRFRDQYVGVSAGGAYVIGADDADGLPFNFEFQIPKIDFGVTSLKRLVHFHLTQRVSGRVQVTTVPDEGDAILYDVNGLADAGIRTRRKKMMKGPRARYWTFKVEGQDGDKFDLDDIELRAQIIHGRRLR